MILSKKGKSTGTLYVKYADPDIARICADTLHNHIIEGRLLKTKLIEAKDDKKLKTPFPKQEEKKKEETKPFRRIVVEERFDNLKRQRVRTLNLLEKYGIQFTPEE